MAQPPRFEPTHPGSVPTKHAHQALDHFATHCAPFVANTTGLSIKPASTSVLQAVAVFCAEQSVALKVFHASTRKQNGWAEGTGQELLGALTNWRCHLCRVEISGLFEPNLPQPKLTANLFKFFSFINSGTSFAVYEMTPRTPDFAGRFFIVTFLGGSFCRCHVVQQSLNMFFSAK